MYTAEITIRLARLDEAEQLTQLALRSKASWGYSEEFMAACRDELTLTAARLAAGMFGSQMLMTCLQE